MTLRPLVLLHGWGLSARVWTELIAALPQELTIHAPDLPGHGHATRAADASLAGWADHLLAAMPQPALLCGWSLGGLIALDLALRHPDRFSGLILFSTSPCFVARDAGEAVVTATHPAEHSTGATSSVADAPSAGHAARAWPHGLAKATVQTFIDGFAANPAATLRRFIALQTVGDGRRRAVSAKLSAALSDTAGARHGALADGLELLARSDLRSQLTTLHMPVELIHGAGDALMPADGARWLARQWPQARLTVVDDCGHAPFLSQPATCAALIARAIQGIGDV